MNAKADSSSPDGENPCDSSFNVPARSPGTEPGLSGVVTWVVHQLRAWLSAVWLPFKPERSQSVNQASAEEGMAEGAAAGPGPGQGREFALGFWVRPTTSSSH